MSWLRTTLIYKSVMNLRLFRRSTADTFFIQALEYPDRIGGINYAPFRSGQDPEGIYPSHEEICEDLALIKKLTDDIRIYSVKSTLQDIPMLAESFGIRVTLGIWIGPDDKSNQDEIDRAIELTNMSSNIVAVLVGNEAIFRQDVSIDQLISYVTKVREKVKVPVSVSEQWHVWEDHSQLKNHVDMVAAHVLPYWELKKNKNAYGLTLDRIQHLEALFPGLPLLITEVGWPSSGARTTKSDQVIYLQKLILSLNAQERRYFVIEAFDQPWKVGEGSVGPHWGIFTALREQKKLFMKRGLPSPGWRYFVAYINLGPRGWLFFIATTIGSSLVLARLSYDAVQHYSTVLGVVASAAWSISVYLGVITEAHELAEAAWALEHRRMFLPLPAPDAYRPKISIHVPCYNEPPHMVIRTLNALADLDYPDYEVLVIDNNTQRHEVWAAVREHCERLGSIFKFFHVSPLEGFKGGALNYLIAETASDVEIIAVIDSDYCVDRLWLKHMAPHFFDPGIAVVQSPQDYRDGDKSLFKSFCYSEYKGFFNIGMIIRNDYDAIIQHGTMTMIRRSVLDKLRWAEWCICEDAELGLRILENGHSTAYCRYSYGKGLIPDTFTDFKLQRFRWAYGAIQIIKRHSSALFLGRTNNLTRRQRYHFLVGWLPWVYESLNLLWSACALLWSMAVILMSRYVDVLPFIFSAPSLLFFFFRIGKTLYLYRKLIDVDFKGALMAVVAGMSLHHTIAKAVLYGVFTSRLPFIRTPKYADRHGFLLALVQAREELLMMMALWAVAVGIVFHGPQAGAQTYCWISMLLVQSLPYLAALMMAGLSAQSSPSEELPSLDGLIE